MEGREDRRAAQPWYDGQSGTPVFPSFHVLAGLAASSGAELLGVELSRKGAVEALALRSGDRSQLWLANLTAERVEVDLSGAGMGDGHVAILDAAALSNAAADPDFLDRGQALAANARIGLDAYAVVRVVCG